MQCACDQRIFKGWGRRFIPCPHGPSYPRTPVEAAPPSGRTVQGRPPLCALHRVHALRRQPVELQGRCGLHGPGCFLRLVTPWWVPSGPPPPPSLETKPDTDMLAAICKLYPTIGATPSEFTHNPLTHNLPNKPITYHKSRPQSPT